LKQGCPVQPHITPVTHTAICSSFDIRRAVSISAEGLARVWNTETGRVPNSFDVGHRSTIGIEFTAGASGLLIASQLGLHLFSLPANTLGHAAASSLQDDLQSSEFVSSVMMRCILKGAVSLWSLSPDRGAVATVLGDCTGPIKITSLTTFKTMDTLPSFSAFERVFPPVGSSDAPDKPRIKTLAMQFSPDGSLIGCGCSDGTLRLWRLSSLHEAAGSVTELFGKASPYPDPTGKNDLDPVLRVSC
jgi:WD40 repeat protein